MLVSIHDYVSLLRSMSMKLKVNLRAYAILLHIPVACLKVVKLAGLPLLRKHMIYTYL